MNLNFIVREPHSNRKFISFGYLFPFLVLLIAPTVQAKERELVQADLEMVFEHPLDLSAAPKRFTEIQDYLSRFAVVDSKYRQDRKIAILTKPLQSGGRFRFVKGEGVRWSSEYPFQSEFLVTAKGIFESSKGAGIKQITEKEQPYIGHFTSVFLAMFSGDVDKLAKQFIPHFSESGGRWVLGLKPRSQRLAGFISKIIIAGEEGIDFVRLQEASGDLAEITLFDVAPSAVELAANERSKFLNLK